MGWNREYSESHLPPFPLRIWKVRTKNANADWTDETQTCWKNHHITFYDRNVTVSRWSFQRWFQSDHFNTGFSVIISKFVSRWSHCKHPIFRYHFWVRRGRSSAEVEGFFTCCCVFNCAAFGGGVLSWRSLPVGECLLVRCCQKCIERQMKVGRILENARHMNDSARRQVAPVTRTHTIANENIPHFTLWNIWQVAFIIMKRTTERESKHTRLLLRNVSAALGVDAIDVLLNPHGLEPASVWKVRQKRSPSVLAITKGLCILATFFQHFSNSPCCNAVLQKIL